MRLFVKVLMRIQINIAREYRWFRAVILRSICGMCAARIIEKICRIIDRSNGPQTDEHINVGRCSLTHSREIYKEKLLYYTITLQILFASATYFNFV